MKSKKQQIYILLFLMILLLIPSSLYASGEEGNLVYFFETDRCLSCIEVKEELTNYPSLDIQSFNIGTEEGRDFLYELAENNSVDMGKLLQTPILVHNNKFYIGQNKIMNDFIPLIQDIPSTEKRGFTSLLVSLFSGVLNGFNPCSIAMYLYVVTLVSNNYGDKKKTMKYILTYILSIFLTYLLIGIMLSKGYVQVESLGRTGQVLQVLMAIVFLILAVYYFRDYLILRKNKGKQLKTQMGGKARSIMEKMLQESISSGSILSPLIGGFIVAIIGFSCTGQIYIATLFYMLSNDAVTANTILYLLFYNFMIVLPLLIFTFLIYKGKQAFKISMAISKRMKEIKLVTSIFFGVIAVYLFVVLLF